MLAEVNQALRDIEGQSRIAVRASVDDGSAVFTGPVLTHSVSESCRGASQSSSLRAVDLRLPTHTLTVTRSPVRMCPQS